MTWPVVRLGDVANTALGKMLDKAKTKGHAHVPYLRNVNVQWGRIDTDDLLTMELADGERERFAVREGDLLVCEGGEIGRCAIWHGRTEYLAYQKALHRIRPSDKLDTRFLRYLLEHHSLSGQLAKLATGTTIAHLPQLQLRRVPVPLPPLDEQRRVVDLLEDHLSRLDAAGSLVVTSLRRLMSLRKSVLADLHDGDPTPLGELAVDSGYGTSEKCVPDGPGPAVVRIPNLVDGRIDLSDEKRIASASTDVERYRLTSGELLIVRTNGSVDLIGRSAVVQEGVDAAFASYLIRYQFRPDRVMPEWVQAMLSTPQVRARIEALAASSAGQHNLSLGKLNPLEIPVPSLDVQAAGLSRFTGLNDQIRRLRNELAAAQSRSGNLRRSVLAAAFSGRLTGDAAADLSAVEEMIGA